VVLLLAACAHGSDPSLAEENHPVPPRPVCRSSIEAVLMHSSELHLTADQVVALSTVDQKLRTENEALSSEKSAEKKAPAGSQPSAPTHSGSQGASPQNQGSGANPGGHGGRMGGGRGMGRMPMGGSRGAPTPGRHEAQSLEERMDDNDTRAYYAAEEILDASQREPARALAEEYREQLFDWREAMRKSGQTAASSAK